MSNPLLRTLGRSSYRALYSVLGGTALALWGMWRGWPWWVALPAGILTTVAVFMALLSALYAYTKVAYPARAEEIRARTNPARVTKTAGELFSACGAEKSGESSLPHGEATEDGAPPAGAQEEAAR